MRLAGETPLLERDAELAVAARVLDAARSRDGGVLLVEGPPGVGKTRVLAAIRESAGELRVLRARGSELEREFPFGVVRQLFEPVLARIGVPERDELLAGAAALAEGVLAPPDDAERALGDMFAALHGLYWFTVNLSEAAPLLLVVDDAHWADSASLRWFTYLGPRLEGLAVALALATRPGEPGAEQVLALGAVSGPVVEVVRPAPLTRAATARLVEKAFRGVPDEPFVAACQRVSGGNPFLLGELLDELRRAGGSPTAANVGLVEHLTPARVSRAAVQRLRRLATRCAALARAVAILGDPVELRIAAELARLDVEEAALAADELAAVSLFEAGRPLRYLHPLLRAGVLGELTAGERAAWHARAAALLRAAGAAPDRLAVHLLHAEPGDVPDAAPILREAARSARARGAPELAASYLRRALRDDSLPALRQTLQLELGVAEFHSGEVAASIDHLHAAMSATDDPQARVAVAARLVAPYAFAGRAEEAVRALTDTIAVLPDDAVELGLRLQVSRFGVAHSSIHAWRLMREAKPRFEAPPGPPHTLGERLATAQRALEALYGGDAIRPRELAGAALHGAEPPEGEEMNLTALFLAPAALLFSDALEEATFVYTAVMDWAQRRGSAAIFSATAHLRALVWYRRGALDEAEADAANARRDVTLQELPYGTIALAMTLVERGAASAAATLWSDQSLDESGTESIGGIVHRQARARVRAALGRHDDALADLRDCGRLEQDWGVRSSCFANWRADAARLLAAARRFDGARELASEELERARAFGSPRVLGAALAAAGVADGGAAGLPLLEEAADVLAASPARLDFAHALVDHGAALRRAGRRAAARDRLATAIELARERGALALARRANDELVAAGARPRRDPVESRSKLTASELRVAGMAAEGMTNKQIAQALFVTEKTVEVHLSNSYRKLDISSRSQLARALPARVAADGAQR